MLDVRDLEVPSVSGVWSGAPRALQAARGLLVLLVALAALRVWMVVGQWPQFVRVFGRWHGLDMSSPAGWTLAGLRTPGQWAVALDLGAALGAAALMSAVVRRWCGARTTAIALSCACGVDVVASVAYPVPWWFLVAGAMLAAGDVALVALLSRPSVSMHLRPEPVSLRERGAGETVEPGR